MMSNICFMSEKLKCSIGCFVVSAEEVEGKSILNIVIIQRVVLDELQYKSLHLRSRTDNRSMKNQKKQVQEKREENLLSVLDITVTLITADLLRF